jgi:hypothetical protein
MLTEGTERSIEDIQKSFSGINEIWHDLANIDFQLIAIVDDAIPSNHAFLMEDASMRRYSRRLNWPYLLNLYCVRDIYGARGTSAFAPSPEYRAGPVHFAVVGDDTDLSRVAAHELGHVLSLYHEGAEENLMHPILYHPTSTAYHPPELRPVQIMVARTHAKRYLRSAAYLSDISGTFREILRSAEDEPPVYRSYFGEGLGEIPEN